MADLKSIMARVQAQRASQSRCSKPQDAGYNYFLLEEILNQVEERRGLKAEKTNLSPPSASWEAAIRQESQRLDPRPSRVFAAYVNGLAANHRAPVYARRGEWLARARSGLPRQPLTPTGFGQSGQREVVRRDGQRVHLGADDLIMEEAFVGGGLLDLALHIEGFVGVDLCELDKWAVATLNKNRYGSYGFGVDFEVKPINANDWEPMRAPGGLDLLTGGPPCQPFSKAADMAVEPLGATSPKNFYPKTLDWIADVQPRVLALENSSQIVENEKYRTWFEQAWVPQVQALGYEVVFWNLSAADYGTPQNRKRAWAIAFPRGASWGRALRSPPPPTHGRPGTVGVGHALLPWTRDFDRLTSGCCNGYYLVDCANLGNANLACRGCFDARNFEAAPNTQGDNARLPLKKLMIGKKSTDSMPRLFEWFMLEEYSNKRPGERRVDWKTPADAAGAWAWEKLEPHVKVVTRYLAHVVTTRSTPPDLNLLPAGLMKWGRVNLREDKPAVLRRLLREFESMSVRDAAKLQDVPQWYAFAGPRSACFRQIGNGVAVNMGRAVARHIRAALGRSVINHAVDIPVGLWPLDRVDPCAGFVGMEGHAPDEDEILQEWFEERDQGHFELTQAERLERPYMAPEFFTPPSKAGIQQTRRTGEQARRIFIPSGYGYLVVDAKALHDSGWMPTRADEGVPPLEDIESMALRLNNPDVPGYDSRGYNHWGLVYRQAFPRVSFARTWPLGEGYPQGLPPWSPFGRRDLRAASEQGRGRPRPRR